MTWLGSKRLDLKSKHSRRGSADVGLFLLAVLAGGLILNRTFKVDGADAGSGGSITRDEVLEAQGKAAAAAARARSLYDAWKDR